MTAGSLCQRCDEAIAAGRLAAEHALPDLLRAHEDAVEEGESLMRAKQVRRLPVVERDRKLVGLLSLNDLARRMQSPVKRSGPLSGDAIAATLSAICEPRESRLAAE